MIKVVELFAGIGAQASALNLADIDYKTVAICENDNYAIKSYELLHGKTFNLGDITKLNPLDVPDCDLLTYSFPCQDLSVAGYQFGIDEGSNTRSSLLWYCKDIISIKKPKYLLMENVKNLSSKRHMSNFQKWLNFLSEEGYKNYWKVLNSVDYGSPQSRERLFCVSILGNEDFTFPKAQPRKIKLKDILEPEEQIPENMYMDKPFIKKETIEESPNGLIQVGSIDMAANECIKRVYSPSGVCPTLTTMTGGHRQPKILINGRVRKLTPKECWFAMGFSEEEFSKVEGQLSNYQLYKQAGNSISVSCLSAIFKQLLK